MMAAPLNAKQMKFVTGIVAGLTATDAYAQAGYKGQGKSGRNAASQLLANIGVQEAIRAHRERAAEATGTSVAWTLAHLRVLALYDGPRSSHLARVAACKAILDYFREPPSAPAPTTNVNVSVTTNTTLAQRIDRYETANAAAADRNDDARDGTR